MLEVLVTSDDICGTRRSKTRSAMMLDSRIPLCHRLSHVKLLPLMPVFKLLEGLSALCCRPWYAYMLATSTELATSSRLSQSCTSIYMEHAIRRSVQ